MLRPQTVIILLSFCFLLLSDSLMGQTVSIGGVGKIHYPDAEKLFEEVTNSITFRKKKRNRHLLALMNSFNFIHYGYLLL